MEEFLLTKEGHEIQLPETYYLRIINIAYSGKMKSSVKLQMKIQEEEKEIMLCTLTPKQPQYSCNMIFISDYLRFELVGEEPITICFSYDVFDNKFEQMNFEDDDQMDFKDMIDSNEEDDNDFFQGIEEDDEDEEKEIQQKKPKQPQRNKQEIKKERKQQKKQNKKK